jgi:hypothetical protein
MATDREDLKPVRVVYRQLDYLTVITNPMGEEVDGIKTAYGPGHPMLDVRRDPDLDPESQEFADKASDFRLGQLIMLRPYQYIGLIKSGAVRDVVTDSSGEEVAQDEELIDIATASVEELADWIRTEKPTANDVVQASNGEPELAEKLLQAETIARDGEPRQGVLRGLSSVAARG